MVLVNNIVFVTILGFANGCQLHWTLINKRCFRLFEQTYDWLHAQEVCQAFDGDLASIHSKNENEAVGKLRHSSIDRIWIGGFLLNKDSNFSWSDDTEWSYSNWGNKETNLKSLVEKCVELYGSNSVWNPRKCESSLYFVCVKDRENK